MNHVFGQFEPLAERHQNVKQLHARLLGFAVSQIANGYTKCSVGNPQHRTGYLLISIRLAHHVEILSYYPGRKNLRFPGVIAPGMRHVFRLDVQERCEGRYYCLVVFHTGMVNGICALRGDLTANIWRVEPDEVASLAGCHNT